MSQNKHHVPVNDTERQPHPSPFVRWLEEQGCLPPLEDAMVEMIRNVTEVGKAGELSMKIKFRPDGEGKVAMTVTMWRTS